MESDEGNQYHSREENQFQGNTAREEKFFNKVMFLYKNVIEKFKNVDSPLFHPRILTHATFENFYFFLRNRIDYVDYDEHREVEK